MLAQMVFGHSQESRGERAVMCKDGQGCDGECFLKFKGTLQVNMKRETLQVNF